MKKDKMVSIIIPVYNTEKYIAKCLDSIVDQTYSNLEIIVVNDGTLENEEEIIRQYMKKDIRITYIKKERNEGLFRARVTGVKAAHGDYIQFVDSDDYINQDFIRLLVEKAEIENSDITFARTVTCTPKGSETIYIFQDTELYKLPLKGTALKKAYYNQHGAAYVWHTIWNKLYKKSLWDIALPYFEKINTHLVMTEDIIFSSVLFYFAKKAVCTDNAVYFYCKHSDASTNSQAISMEQYKRQLSNVCTTFEFLDDFFRDKEAWIKRDVREFRENYGRMWHRLAEDMEEPEREEAIKLSQKLVYMDEVKISSLDDNYFCYMEVPYSSRLDEIKKWIVEGTEQVISFDVFDTVVTRPFYRSTDLFHFLDKKYEEYSDSNISFYTIRTQGEQGCREKNCNSEKEDVDLDEIYDYISESYGIPRRTAYELKEYEKSLEIWFSNKRNIGYELYRLALACGKKVIFVSDMYLPKEVIATILLKNGYDVYDKIFVSSEYKKLKKTSNLYKVVLSLLQVEPKDIIHIGDSRESDINGADKVGISTIHIPKTLDTFCGCTNHITNNHRLIMGKEIAGHYCGNRSFEKSLPYGAAMAIAANRYFDNPCKGFNDFTDFNVDSYFAGYYLLGTNLIGQIAWLERVICKNNISRVVFTSRDGYLLMKAYKKYLKICNKEQNISYLYVSRRSMMSWILKDKVDFMNLPIVYQKYCPNAIDELLGFCIDHKKDNEWKIVLSENEIDSDKEFLDINEYLTFMKIFMEYRYDAEAHKKTQKIVAEYCSDIRDDDGIFDLGYSASIHKAICDASGKKPRALFMHSDLEKHIKNARMGEFAVETMMDTVPNVTGLMREFFFSDLCGSCVGYTEQNGKMVPVIEEENKHYADLFPIRTMHMAALTMVGDFYNQFHDFLSFMEIRTEEMLMPFESFLTSPKSIDTKMFVASYFEDRLYGKIDKINVRDFWTQILLGQPGYKKSDLIHYFDELLKKFHKKKLAFFGTGKMCEAMFETNPDIPVDVYLDNNRSKTGMEYRGKKIMHPENYPNLKELYIVVVIAFYKEVEEQLRDLGLTKYEDYLNYLELF